jgi:glutamyl-tRNA reductase
MRGNRELFIIDISLPRSIDPNAAKIEHVHLYNTDDLRHTVDSNMELRKRETEKAMHIIEEKVPDIVRTLDSFDIIPIITSIRRYADAVEKEIEQKLLAKDCVPRKLATEMTDSLVGRILHYTTEQLRDYAHSVNNKR